MLIIIGLTVILLCAALIGWGIAILAHWRELGMCKDDANADAWNGIIMYMKYFWHDAKTAWYEMKWMEKI